MMMEKQLQRSKDEIEQMDKIKAEIESALEQMQSRGGEIDSAQPPTKRISLVEEESQQALNDPRQVWDILDKEV